MIKSLFLTKADNGKVLDNATKELKNYTGRTFSGSNWNFVSFINADMKNYTAETHFILDVSAIAQQGEEFIELLHEMQEKSKNAVIILYCGDLTAGDLFLHQLARAGFTNIIAQYSGIKERQNYELMQADLREALTNGIPEHKWERFILPDLIDEFNDEVIEAAEVEEIQKRDYSWLKKDITVFGSQRRIGTTTFAMNLCNHVAENGGKAAFILNGNDAEKEFDLMCSYYGCANDDRHIVMNNFDVCTMKARADLGDYNLVVFDCGDIHQNAEKLEEFKEVDAIYLCCGVGWNELHHTSTSHMNLEGLTYTAVVNTDDDSLIEMYREVLCRNCNEAIGIRFDDDEKIAELINA